MRRTLVAALLTVVMFFAASAPPAPQPAQAFDPQVQIAKAAFAAFKARFHDRAAGFRTIKESQAEAVAILEEKKAQANWAADKGYITKEQAAAVAATLDKVAGSLEELAKQERRMVRNDTRFLKTFAQSLGRTLTDAAPQILAEQIGLPPLGARTVGSIIQGEKPAVAAVDALITKLSGEPLVEPSKEPFEDLMTQVDALQEAASALRGADRIKLLGELTGVRQRISDITGLPIPEATAELEQLRAVFDEAEATIAELGEVRDGWVPRYAGPSSERFQNNPQWQEIWAEIVGLSQSPETKIKDAVAAGMSLTALEKVKEELIAQGIDPDSVDLEDLAAQVVRERIRGLAGGSPITVEQAVQTVLGVPGSPGDGDEPDLDPEADADGDTIANASDLCPRRPETFNGIDDFDGCPDSEDDPDGDGIEGDSDECPDKAEDRDGFEDSDGCPDPDNDGDGILDASDSCRDEAEDLDGFEDSNGCPDPDNDGDGILDTDDSCPDDAEDPDGYQDSDGCPDPDNDEDTVLDTEDSCPDDPEDLDGFQDADGCPDPDNDGDGVSDSLDICPDDPEDIDGVDDWDGCPDIDTDGDNIADPADTCPNDAEDYDGFEDGDGCPDPDNDGDTVPDTLDQCPNQAEDLDGVEDGDGCPEEPLPSRPLSYGFPLGNYSATLTGVIDFASGTASGTLAGSWTQLAGQFNCGQGDQVIETAEAHATARFSTGFSAPVPQSGGAFSTSVSISGTLSYALTKPFTDPNCTSGNSQIIAQFPPPDTFTSSGTISGTAFEGSPTTITVNTTFGNFSQ